MNKLFGIAAMAALALAGCGKAGDDGKAAAPARDRAEVVATVNGKNLTYGEVADDVAKVMEAQKDRMPKDVTEEQKAQFSKQVELQLVQQFITKTLLLDEAKAKKIVVTDAERKQREDEFVKANANVPGAPKSIAEFAEKYPFGKDRAMQEFADGVLIQKLLEQEVSSKIKVDAKEVEKQLAEAKSAAEKAAKDAASAATKIKELKKQLDGLKGDALVKKFAELAKANSDCPSKEKGGDLGTFTRGRMVKEFEEAAFKLAPYTVSEPVKTQFGWHLIMTTNKVAAVEAKGDQPAKPEEVQASHILLMAREAPAVPNKDDVEKRMKSREQRQAMGAYFENLRKNAKIATPGYPELTPPAETAPAAKPAAKPADAAKPAEAKK